MAYIYRSKRKSKKTYRNKKLKRTYRKNKGGDPHNKPKKTETDKVLGINQKKKIKKKVMGQPIHKKRLAKDILKNFTPTKMMVDYPSKLFSYVNDKISTVLENNFGLPNLELKWNKQQAIWYITFASTIAHFILNASKFIIKCAPYIIIEYIKLLMFLMGKLIQKIAVDPFKRRNPMYLYTIIQISVGTIKSIIILGKIATLVIDTVAPYAMTFSIQRNEKPTYERLIPVGNAQKYEEELKKIYSAIQIQEGKIQHFDNTYTDEQKKNNQDLCKAYSLILQSIQTLYSELEDTQLNSLYKPRLQPDKPLGASSMYVGGKKSKKSKKGKSRKGRTPQGIVKIYTEIKSFNNQLKIELEKPYCPIMGTQ